MTKKTKHISYIDASKALLTKHSSLAILGGSTLLVAVLVLGGSTPDPEEQRAKAYSDVLPGSSPAAAIDEMATLGIIRGYDNGLFGPNDPVTRAQAAILLQRIRDREIKALRAQVEELRKALSLGSCGDAEVQTGEECDDGNTVSRDGCSQECLKEISHSSAPEMSEEESDDVPAPTPINTNMAPTCGNRICEPKENTLPPDRRFYCPQDCTGEAYVLQCAPLTEEFEELASASQACGSDDDCTKLEQSCPYLSCAVAVNKMNFPTLSMKRDAVLAACENEGALQACVRCAINASICMNGQCVIVEEQRF
jgi:cysteine-rich repeat protein